MSVRFIYILIITLFPGILFSQNIRIRELQTFVDIKQGNYSKAVDSLDILISENPAPEFYLAKVEAFYELGNYKKAIECCNKLDKLKQFYSSAYKVKIFLSLNDPENAKNALEDNLRSKYKISLFDLLDNIEFSGIYNLGLDQYILSGNFYSQTEKQIYQVERLIQDDKYTQALFVINEILSRNNNIAQAHYLKSRIAYFEGGLQGALQSINSAIELKKSRPEYLKQRVTLNKEINEYDAALQDINKLTRINPYEIDNYIIKANLLFKTANFDKAINLTNSILKVLPENPDVLYLSSKSYFKNKDYFEALKAINQSMQIKSNKDFYELRGDIYSATNTYEYAIRDYSMYLDIEPYNGDIYAKKGFARLKLGDKKGACSDWEKGKRYGSYEAIVYLEKYCN
ncbi:MAG: tetratricopeptide repeat protein [Bacteroidales bacterium]|nr:tetratricopeptide repeat protein [Bacteroidales bacterium]